MSRSVDNKVVMLKAKKSAAYNAAAEKKQNYIGNRIAEGRHMQKLSLAAFSDLLVDYGVDITPGAISRWELGKSVPSAYQLFAVAHALKLEEDMFFFVGGKSDLNAEGRKKLHDYKEDLIASGRYKVSAPKPSISYVIKPVSYLPASAGTGAFLDEGQFENVRFPENAVPAGADFALRISGDSMEPVYHDGQIVWVEKCNELHPGEVGIFIYEGSGYIKAYDEREPSDDLIDEFTDSYGNVRMQPVLISYNEDYAPIEVQPSALFQISGKVL